MSPLVNQSIVGPRPRRRLYLWSALGIFCLALLLPTGSVEAQKKGKKSKAGKKAKENDKPIAKVKEKKNKAGGKDQNFDFTGLSLSGSVRTPQLLYFLDRASEELKRASLERRSFVPEMILSISEEGL